MFEFEIMNGMLIGRWPIVQKECGPMGSVSVNLCVVCRSLTA